MPAINSIKALKQSSNGYLSLSLHLTLRLIVVLISVHASTFIYAAESLRTQGFVVVPGGPVWFEVDGISDTAELEDEEGEIPLVTLHGGPGGTSCGFTRLYGLGKGRPVLRYDQLGTGRSGRPNDMSLWTVGRYVDELHILRQKLGLEQIHLLGHSWGGALAAAYVLEKGTKGIVSLTLSSPLLSSPAWMEDANYLRAQLPAAVQQVLDEHEAAGSTDSDEYAAATDEFYRRYVRGGDSLEPLAACAGADGNNVIYEYMWGETEFNATGTLVDFDVTDRLDEIDIPVLLIGGEFDEARPERLAQFQDMLPNAQLETIDAAAHGTISRQPEAYRKRLEAFLSAAEGGSVLGNRPGL
jgi:proline iminopeptidase